ncbi:MAG: hypothetical protein E7580_07605 [Ruminococcaceae bacterium]|nr:hypothetical protein [Oscillospiraceae bacterium]
MDRAQIPQPLFTGVWGKNHIQGICVDQKKGYIYYSFTTCLVKATLDGKVVGSVTGLLGHLGCIAMGDDGYVYGSLEYKIDAIGKGVLERLGTDASFREGFYVVRFDADRIDAEDISADGNDLMTAVYIREAVEDYNGFGTDQSGARVPHRLGCSGIDGLTFAPLPGKTETDGKYLYVAYGVYSDLAREDNDYQVLLCYDPSDWNRLARPLKQEDMHVSGFDAPLHKFFVFTGNTNYGVQNLEYDPLTHSIYMAVYVGKKAQYPNYPMFAVDLSVPAKTEDLRGLQEKGEVLTLRCDGETDPTSGVSGYKFKLGTTGMYSFGDGEWLFSDNRKCTGLRQCGFIFRYEYVGGKDAFLLKIE